MMTTNNKFIVKGRKPLFGEIEVLGSKNASGPIIAGTLLTSQECIIDNIALTSDVLNMIDLIKELGAEVEFLNKRKISVKAEKLSLEGKDLSKASEMRMSVLLIGALSSRFSFFKIPSPGGDKIGLRPISVHINAFKELGIKVVQKDGFYKVKKEKEKKKIREVVLDEFSVTATENLILASVLLEGKTIIKGIALEPHVQDLIKMLKNMGAKIKYEGIHTLVIEGVKKIKGTTHRIIPDYIETGTFVILGGLTRGKIKIKNAVPEHLDIFLKKMEEIGINFKRNKREIEVFDAKKLRPVKIQALPHPGFPTDLLPITVPLLTQAKGRSLVHDPLYENRLGFVQELRKMGADIEMVDPHRVFVFGKTPLFGSRIDSWDIRAGACLLLAALVAKGKTTIGNIYQIDRGYENIDERLKKLGAEIKRC